MNLDDLSTRIGKLAEGARVKIASEMETVATTGYSLVQRRVSETGKDADGRAFTPYTPIYERFKRGAIGQKAKKEGAKKKAERKTKAASPGAPVGRYRGIVDFTLSGQMLNSIGIVEAGFKGNAYVVRVGGRDQETRDKMAGNAEYRPGWTRLSKEEKDTLAKGLKERMTDWAQKELQS
jgi:hypothetical protein